MYARRARTLADGIADYDKNDAADQSDQHYEVQALSSKV